jgi:hypothetical protein
MNAEAHSSALRYLMVRTTAFVTLTALSAAVLALPYLV